MDFSEDGNRLLQLGEGTMERMTVNYDSTTDKVVCDPDTIHVSKFCREDILFVLHDDIVDTYDFAKEPKEAIAFANQQYGKRFFQVRLNDKTLWVHDDNTEHHKGKEIAKFTLTITEQATNNNESLDPQFINE